MKALRLLFALVALVLVGSAFALVEPRGFASKSVLRAPHYTGLRTPASSALPTFDPTQVSGMAAWWAARMESFANNDAVGTMTDWSGNGLHLTQATASKKPTFKTAQKNGQPAFQADGVDDFVSGGNILNIGTGSIHFFIVAKFDSLPAISTVLAKAVQAGAVNRWGFYQYNTPNGWEFILQDSAGTQNATGGTRDTNWHLFELVADRTAAQIQTYVDGSMVASDTIDSGNFTSTWRFLLFAFNNSTDTGEVLFMSGKIAEVWCWQRILDAGERTTLRNGVNTLYAIY